MYDLKADSISARVVMLITNVVTTEEGMEQEIIEYILCGIIQICVFALSYFGLKSK